MLENISYSIVNGQGENAGDRIGIEYDDIGGYDGVPAKAVTISLSGPFVKIQPQQLAELGALFLALAGTVGIDYSGADALLEGYSLKGKQAAELLYRELEE